MKTSNIAVPVRALNAAIRSEVRAEINAAAKWYGVAVEVAAKLDADTLTGGLAAFSTSAKESRRAEVAAAALPDAAAKRLDSRIRKRISRARKAIIVIVKNGGEAPAGPDGEPISNLNAFEQYMAKAATPAPAADSGKSFNDQLVEMAAAITRARSAKRKAELADELANMINKRLAPAS
jgi:hypothetical protein